MATPNRLIIFILCAALGAAQADGANVEALEIGLRGELQLARDALLSRPTTPEERIAAAVLLAEIAPSTPQRRAHAARELRELAAGSTPAGRAAAYQLARLTETCDELGGPAAAREIYAQLRRDAPGDPSGQRATVRLALLLLAEAATAVRTAKREEISRWAPGLADPDARRDLHLALAVAAERAHAPAAEQAQHWNAALALGVRNAALRATVLLKCAERNREAGALDAARVAYARFLAEFPADRRASTVQRRSGELP